MTGLLLAALLAAAPAVAADPLDARRQVIASEVTRVGAELQRAIEAGDTGALLARVPASGLRCGARVVPREKVRRDLQDPRSWLHGALVGGAGYAPPRGGPASLRAFFEHAREIAVAVSFLSDPRAGPVGRPCLEYRSHDTVAPAVPLCFEARGGRWWLTDSLYPCG